ncbi:hypothetical protein HMPREF0650_2427 [Hoylesella buccalis ATCC 35310]|uniref:Uncharacterized protein n=1 Tax=Hoylesella buccalis ATCC 35310 TaxID=679190 RepID=D1W7D6_9BACT|nr:hypothetical protein HMPREF0650_2427 [Hoylesella buccalis ATCC 35310]
MVVNDLRTFKGKTTKFGVDLLGLLLLYGYINFILIYIKKHCFCVKNHLLFLGCVRKQQYLCIVNETKRMSGDVRNKIDSIENLRDIIGIRPKGKR